MTHNLFDNAKFGDMFLTTENKQAVFLRFSENAEYKFAILYVEGWGNVQVFRHNGKEIYNDAAHSIISKQEEPVSNPTPTQKMSVERWKKACEAAFCDINYRSHYGLTETRDDYFVDGVQWADENPKEEHVNRTPADVESAMQEVEEKSRVFTEAHKGEDADTILAQMRGEEPASEDLEEASKEWLRPQLDKSYANYGEAKMMELTHFDGYSMLDAIEFGAKWKEEHLWKSADGDDLPEIDREVVVLIKYDAQRNIHDEEYPTYRVGFGHRPNPNGWDGKNIDTNEVTHYTPKLYDKGGWNAPDIVYWLDIELPKEIEL